MLQCLKNECADKKLVEFEKLDSSSTDILEGSMIDIFYPARTKDLENVCLYDFIQWYEYHGASSDGTRVYQKLNTPLLPNHKLLSAQLCQWSTSVLAGP